MKSSRLPLIICSFLVLAANGQNKFFKQLKTKDVASNPTIVWKQFGPGMSGNNKCAFWHRTDPSTLFISPNMGNSYVSNDAGLTYQTVLDEDGSNMKRGERGPSRFGSVSFSHKTPEFGIATDIKGKGLWKTDNKGSSWEKHQKSLKTFKDAYLSCVSIDKSNENIIYVGAGRMNYLGKILFSEAKPHGTYTDGNSQGMIWKSLNMGKTWELINNGLHNKAEVENIIIDPINNDVVYVSTNYGFYKSTNGGRSWHLKSKGLDTDVIRSFKMHYNKKTGVKTFYLVASVLWKAQGKTIIDKAGGIFKSVDDGESWQKINGNLAMDMSQFTNDKFIEKSYYHTLGYYFGISDAKARELYPELPKSITQRFTQITVDPNDADNIYIINMYTNASRNNFMPGAMWRSKDGGKHWYVTFRNGKRWNEGKDLEYWKKRNNPTGSNVQLLYLNDWTNRDDYDRKSVNYAKFNADGTILHTQMAKISLMSYDKGDTWVDIDDVETTAHSESYIGAGNSNLPGHGFYQDTRFPGKVFCSAGENSLWVTNDEISSKRKGAQAATFHNLLGVESSLSCYAIHPKDSNIHYSMYFRQHERGNLMRSIDGGKTWEKHGVAIPKWEIKAHSGDQPVHQVNLIFDPNNPDVMYFCVPKSSSAIEYVGNSETGFGIHKSIDGGKTWKEINNGLPKPFDVTTIRFASKDSKVLYATVQNKNGGLYKSTNAGVSWEKVKSTMAISGEFGINDIHFSKDNKVYISAGSARENVDKGGLWVSEDNMKSWKRIFDYPWVNRVEVAKYNSDVILISTLANVKVEGRNAGTYLSKNGGESWVKINKGNGQSDRINDIAIDYTVSGKYYVSTYGSGFYVAKE